MKQLLLFVARLMLGLCLIAERELPKEGTANAARDVWKGCSRVRNSCHFRVCVSLHVELQLQNSSVWTPGRTPVTAFCLLGAWPPWP